MRPGCRKLMRSLLAKKNNIARGWLRLNSAAKSSKWEGLRFSLISKRNDHNAIQSTNESNPRMSKSKTLWRNLNEKIFNFKKSSTNCVAVRNLATNLYHQVVALRSGHWNPVPLQDYWQAALKCLGQRSRCNSVTVSRWRITMRLKKTKSVTNQLTLARSRKTRR